MIHWNVQPELVHLGPLAIRWYGLLFASGFLVGFQVMRKFFRADGVSEAYLDPLLIYMALGTIIGARLGHTLFYEPEIYLADPIRILKIWEGGLASHGAAVGITTAVWLFTRRYRQFTMLWLLDRLAVPTALAGAFIRLGNFFNSEIVGKPSHVPWAVVFERVDQLPRHPAQLYESLSYLLIFLVLYRLFWDTRVRKSSGLIFGVFLTAVFAARFIIEFLKENQVAFESKLVLDMGQLLSIPVILIGMILIVRGWKSLRSEGVTAETAPSAPRKKKQRQKV